MIAPLLRVIHFGPLIALSIIKCVVFTTLYLTGQWLRATDSLWALFNYMMYYTLIATTFYNFFSAVFTGPGQVPKGWQPADPSDCQLLQYCHQCRGYKPPRSHHCRRCDRCVLKMDHHCPWINNCTGYRNQCYFILFLGSAVLGSIQSIVLLSIGLYRAFYWNWFLYNERSDRLVYITMTSLLFGVFSIGLALGVIIAVGGLLILQLKILVKNETSIEEWIVTKAKSRRGGGRSGDQFVYPYNLGVWRNIRQVLFGSIDNGISWPVIDGCDQYTLTVEQLLQKEEKRNRSATFRAIAGYNGHWFPLFSQGCRICLAFPMSDEPRIKVTTGDHILVTRCKNHWMYGEKVVNPRTPIIGGHHNNNHNHRRERGWFPRKIVIHVQTAATATHNHDVPVPQQPPPSQQLFDDKLYETNDKNNLNTVLTNNNDF
ncbi:palmitoyltransferase ZDHHC6-like, partial [Oppia nitens]|uniref:palmitoyltransferase ZDHHC6-like n=1 Tax=Oppia nitens TaxID=1686743 RepID=UPI0023DC2540